MPDNYMKIRISEDEKQLIKDFCASKGMSVSSMLRFLIFNAIQKEGKQNATNE